MGNIYKKFKRFFADGMSEAGEKSIKSQVEIELAELRAENRFLSRIEELEKRVSDLETAEQRVARALYQAVLKPGCKNPEKSQSADMHNSEHGNDLSHRQEPLEEGGR